MTTRELPIGHATLSLETGKLAKQADGSVIVRFGDSVVLVTACRNSSPREGIDFLPLTVDYREYTYASGRIPGGFFKREGKPSEKEVLTSRVIDRPIRPLFPAGWRFETQIIALVLSADSENDTDVLALTGASAALALSDIPFQKTIAGVRVGLVDGQYLINPTFAQRKESKLDLVVAGSKDGLVMVEAGAKEVSEEQVVEALEAAHAAIKQIVAVIDDLAKTVGKKKVTVDEKGSRMRHSPRASKTRSSRRCPPRCASTTSWKTTSPSTRCSPSSCASLSGRSGRAESRRQGGVQGTQGESPLRRGPAQPGAARRPQVRRGPADLDRDERAAPDARLRRLHARRNPGARHLHARHRRRCAEDRDASRARPWKSFMLHYNFPPFSVGEVGRMTGPGRREIGHGALAERALAGMVPGEETSPTPIRIVSDILESNGSSSMASVCGGTLAMMDAGVPIKSPVAGIAMGLVMDEKSGKFAVLSDIAGAEDHYGDMDFKVAGTAAGHHRAADGHQGRRASPPK